ncbi:MAG: TonB-dependent receptor [Bryobacteraceae bacterium]
MNTDKHGFRPHLRSSVFVFSWCACLAAVTSLPAQSTGQVRGVVLDSRGGEALSNVTVSLAASSYRVTTDTKGHFDIPSVPPGDYVLHVSTVGYHLLQRPFHVNPGEVQDFEVVLTADTLRQTETVEVKAGPFDIAPQDSPSAITLSGNDSKNLASVLADDPLRAVQNLPGVTSNNDFDARFSLRGADFSRIGVYLDGVLLHEPFHTLQGQDQSASATAFNGDMVDEMTLYEGAYPARYGDSSAAVLDVETRDGSRDETLLRASASTSNASFMAEGPLGKKKRGSWLVAVRKSYLQYLLARTFPNATLDFGLEDVQGRLSYDLDAKNRLTLYILESFTGLDRSAVKNQLGDNALLNAGYHYTLANLGWRFTPNDQVVVTSHAAWMREKYGDNNPNDVSLDAGYYGEWVWNTTATWMWSSAGALNAGWSMRLIRDSGFANQFVTSPLRIEQSWNGTARMDGGYLQQSYALFGGRLRLTGGVRSDHDTGDGVTATSPTASANLALTKSTHFQLGFGQYVQFPDLSVQDSTLGGSRVRPMRSNQAIAAIEQRFGQRTRLRLETYNRADRDLIDQPYLDPRILDGRVLLPPPDPRYFNAVRGYARGAEIVLQRSSANRFTGWVSYGFGRTEMRDGASGARFVSDWDQRHTINIYGAYRLRPSVNLSGRSSWGSGFPLPGFIQMVNGNYYLSSVRNSQRLGPYSRTDGRINKAWSHDRWKMTLYGEVVNLTDHANYAFESLDSVDRQTGLVHVTIDKMFPILPSAGLVFER